MTDMTMKERLARAIAVSVLGPNGGDVFHVRMCYSGKTYMDAAEAVLDALREPTVSAIDVACAKWIELYPSFDGEKPQPTAGDVAKVVWQAMIDAAKAEDAT